MSRVVETGYSCGPKEYRYSVRLKEPEQQAFVRYLKRRGKEHVARELNRIIDEALEDMMLEDS